MSQETAESFTERKEKLDSQIVDAMAKQLLENGEILRQVRNLVERRLATNEKRLLTLEENDKRQGEIQCSLIHTIHGAKKQMETLGQTNAMFCKAVESMDIEGLDKKMTMFQTIVNELQKCTPEGNQKQFQNLYQSLMQISRALHDLSMQRQPHPYPGAAMNSVFFAPGSMPMSSDFHGQTPLTPHMVPTWANPEHKTWKHRLSLWWEVQKFKWFGIQPSFPQPTQETARQYFHDQFFNTMKKRW